MLAAISLLAGISACSGKNDTGADISGQWHLVETGNLIGGQELDIDVYASFTAGTFTLYQKVGTGLGTRRSGQVWAGTGIMKGHTLSPETMS